MPPNAARKMSAREHTRPCPVPPPGQAAKSHYRPRRETTKPFGTKASRVIESDIREIAGRPGHRPPAPCGPSAGPEAAKRRQPSLTPKASVSLASFRSASASPSPKQGHLRAVSAPRISTPPPLSAAAQPAAAQPAAAQKEQKEKDATPTGPRPVARIPAPPPLPREALIQMQTTELPLEEIDYDEAYGYDPAALRARLSRSSMVPEKLVAVIDDGMSFR